MEEHRLAYASAMTTGEPVGLSRRLSAALLDVVILGPPVAALCFAGAFGSETTHRQPDPAYLLAGGIAVCYAVVEALCGITPGLLIIGARIMSVAGDKSVRRRALRWAMKYPPYLCACVLVLADGRYSSESTIGVLATDAAYWIGLCGAVITLLSVAKHVLRREQSPLYFDPLAKTRVMFTGRQSATADPTGVLPSASTSEVVTDIPT